MQSRGNRRVQTGIPLTALARVAFVVVVSVLWISCSGGSSGSSSTSDPPQFPTFPAGDPIALSSTDVDAVVKAAVMSVNVPMVVAVADRLGNVLAIYETANAPTTGIGNFRLEPTVGPPDADNLAVALARTAAFFSNTQAPLSSRTVRFISGIHFPPGVAGAANADLYGIENTNRGCTLDPLLPAGVKVAKGSLIDGTSNGLGVITGKASFNDEDPNAINDVTPGGVPIYKVNTSMTNHSLVGGVGVAIDPATDPTGSIAEFAAFTGAFAGGLQPLPVIPLPPPGEVLIGGVALPFVNQTTIPWGFSPGTLTGGYKTNFSPIAGTVQPEGYLLGPNAGSALTQSDVSTIVQNAIATASITRAQIRLPLEVRTAMTIAVADTNGTLLALYRMKDGTIFSTDVAVTKARNVAYFSTTASTVATDLPGVPPGTAVTNRTISFGAQPLFPPGINGSSPGPFYQLFLNDIANPCTQGSQIVSGGSPHANQSGIVFFPGSETLYKNGVIVGGLGVSGDGVEQDDYVTAGGAAGFEPVPSIRADQVFINGVRLPYLKFPRNPTD